MTGKNAQGDEIEVAGILPGDDRESAILATLITVKLHGHHPREGHHDRRALIEECRMGN